MMFGYRHEMREPDERIYSRWVEIVNAHLATSKKAQSSEGWIYKQRLVHDFASPAFWVSVPGTLPIHLRQAANAASLEEVQAFGVVAVVLEPQVLSAPFFFAVSPQSMPPAV
jgi:hypothetical protein